MTPDQKADIERVRAHLERHWLTGLTIAHVLTVSFDNKASKAALCGFAEHVKRQKRGNPIMVRSEDIAPQKRSGYYASRRKAAFCVEWPARDYSFRAQ